MISRDKKANSSRNLYTDGTNSWAPRPVACCHQYVSTAPVWRIFADTKGLIEQFLKLSKQWCHIWRVGHFFTERTFLLWESRPGILPYINASIIINC